MIEVTGCLCLQEKLKVELLRLEIDVSVILLIHCGDCELLFLEIKAFFILAHSQYFFIFFIIIKEHNYDENVDIQTNGGMDIGNI